MFKSIMDFEIGEKLVIQDYGRAGNKVAFEIVATESAGAEVVVTVKHPVIGIDRLTYEKTEMVEVTE